MDIQTIIQEFAMLFAVIDPIGTVPVFLAVTAGMTAKRSRAVAFRAVLIAGLVLIGFIAVGQIVLEKINISLVSFQIAGGIIFFLFGLSMIFGTSKPEKETDMIEQSDTELAVFPLAIPSIAGPGPMLAVVLLTDNRDHPLQEQLVSAGLLLVVLAIVLGLMLLAHPIQRLIGKGGAAVISRIMGMIIAAIAVESIMEGIAQRFSL